MLINERKKIKFHSKTKNKYSNCLMNKYIDKKRKQCKSTNEYANENA